MTYLIMHTKGIKYRSNNSFWILKMSTIYDKYTSLFNFRTKILIQEA